MENQVSLRQKVESVLAAIGDGWFDWNDKSKNDKMNFFDHLAPDIIAQGDWWLDEQTGVEHAHVKIAREVKENDTIIEQPLGEIETKYGFLVSKYRNNDRLMPYAVLEDGAQITVTSPNYQKDPWITTEIVDDKISVRYAQNETALDVVNRFGDAIAASKQRAAAKKLHKLNLSTKTTDLLAEGNVQDNGRQCN